MSLDDCVRATGVCRGVIKLRIREGRLTARLIGGRLMVRPEHLRAWVDAEVPLEEDHVEGPSRGVVRPPDPATGSDPVGPERARDWARWRAIWRRVAPLEGRGYSVKDMVKTLKQQGVDLRGVSQDTLPRIIAAGKAGLLE